MKNCECYFVTEVDGEYKSECELTGKCPLEEDEGGTIMDTYEGPSEEELYHMEKLQKNTLYGSAGRPNNLMSTDGELKQWQKDIMDNLMARGCCSDAKTNDPVNHPSHYTDGKIEVIDFIEDKKLGFHLGNAVKYIARAGKKDPGKRLEDLHKAKWYLDRYIEMQERPEPIAFKDYSPPSFGDTDGDMDILKGDKNND